MRLARSLLLAAAGLVLLAAAQGAQRAADADDARRALAGLPAQGTAVPWVLGVLGAACVAGAFVHDWLARRAEAPRPPRLVPGWYDDPDSPHRLRYHDGAGWTGRTAEKG